MPCCRRILPVIVGCCACLLEPQASNLALLIGALPPKRSLCLTALARAFPVPAVRAVPAPKRELLRRLKRLSRFLSNERIDPVAVQIACIPAIVRKLGTPPRLGLVIDWTNFDVTLPKLDFGHLGVAGRSGRLVKTLGGGRRCRPDHGPFYSCSRRSRQCSRAGCGAPRGCWSLARC